MSKEGDDAIVNQILQKCNPKSVAKELIRDLEENAAEAAKKGEHSAFARFITYHKSGYSGKETGLLVDFPNSHKATETLFKMVQEYVTDKEIQLELSNIEFDSGEKNFGIKAKVEW